LKASKRIKVLIEILNSDLNTGAANDCLDFARYAQSMGIDLVFAGQLSDPMIFEARQRNVQIIKSRCRSYSRSTLPLFLIDAIRWMRRLRKDKIDVVHLDYSGWGPSLAYAAHRLGIPVVMRAGGIYHSKNPANHWIDAFAANCIPHAESLLNSPLAAKVQVLGSFFDVVRLTPPFHQIKTIPPRLPDIIRFLYIGQLAPRKGLSTLLKAFADLTKSADLVLSGGKWSQDGYPSEIKAISRDLGLLHKVHFEDHRSDVACLLTDCDVFVLPSLQDARPRVIIEAMYLGKPVLATKVGGIPTLVEDELTGLLVPHDDPISMTKAMERLAGEHVLRRFLGDNARKRAHNELHPATTAENYANMYRRLCDAKRGYAT
jgi:glycosyltransferase involved in cell wall biosynthesis